jgi:hypothetical protein
VSVEELQSLTHAQCFYKTDNAKGSSPTANLLAKKEKPPPYTKSKPPGPH